MSDYLSKSVKEFIKKRAHGRCEYCQWFDDFTPGPFNIEHIIPSSKGGLTTLENLAFACSGCNGHKANKIEFLHAETNELVTLFNPREQIWTAHFTWDDTQTQLLGLTATGDVTIQALQMNRTKLIRLREVFLKLGLHPPKW